MKIKTITAATANRYEMKEYTDTMARGYAAARDGRGADAEWHFHQAVAVAFVRRKDATYSALVRVTWTIAHDAASAAADTVRKAFNPPVGQVRG